MPIKTVSYFVSGNLTTTIPRIVWKSDTKISLSNFEKGYLTGDALASIAGYCAREIVAQNISDIAKFTFCVEQIIDENGNYWIRVDYQFPDTRPKDIILEAICFAVHVPELVETSPRSRVMELVRSDLLPILPFLQKYRDGESRWKLLQMATTCSSYTVETRLLQTLCPISINLSDWFERFIDPGNLIALITGPANRIKILTHHAEYLASGKTENDRTALLREIRKVCVAQSF